MQIKSNHIRTQQGAALIIALLLLLVLTILGISGMNSASLEFIMAGNEQFKNSAFQAAETGNSIAYQQVINNTALLVPGVPATVISTLSAAGQSVTGSGGDTYSTTVTYDDEGAPPPGFSLTGEVVSGEYFTIRSIGSSARNALSTVEQGLTITVPGGP
jgi:type IV pilus assembly protein PilX